MSVEISDEIQAVLKAQTKVIWSRIARKYKIHRNIKIKLAAVDSRALSKVFNCGDCGPAIVKLPPKGQVIAILRLPLEYISGGTHILATDTIPHGLAHIACMLRPDLGHGYIHDAGLIEVYNWGKENA